MSVYKVAQDVEADDKLIGPFSFRQFIYLIIAVGSIGLAWGLAQLSVVLIVIPLPFIVLFGALALPLRKDQPMEVYLAAVVSFHLKPKKRLWVPDGIQSLVEITAPKIIEPQRFKDLSQYEADRRFAYLADIMDTEGWAVRDAASAPDPGTAMINDVYYAAKQVEDPLDDTSGIAQSINTMINQTDNKRREELMQRIHEPTVLAPPPPTVSDLYADLASSTPATHQTTTPVHLSINPYPTSMHQSVIQPIAPNAAPPGLASQTTSVTTPSSDIISLANNTDLSIETIAHEAKRIREKELRDGDEVVISLH